LLKMELRENDSLVSVKFCGGCNPVIDRWAVFNELKEILFSTHQISVAVMPIAKWLLIISGCKVSCASVPKVWTNPDKIIRVAGTAVNGCFIIEKEIAAAIVRIIAGTKTPDRGKFA